MSKWIKCKKCGREYDNSIKQCPVCYNKTPMRLKDIVTAVITVLLVVGCVVGVYLALTDDGGVVGTSSSASSAASTLSSDGQSSSIASSSASSAQSAALSKPSSDRPTSSAGNYKQPSDGDGNVIVGSNGTVKFTIPKWLLLLTEPDFDYKLTDTEKNEYKFTGINKNSDGSATYSIGYNDYHKFRLIMGSSTTASVTDFKKLSTVRDVQYSNGYGKVKIFTTYLSIDEIDGQFSNLLLVAGIKTTTYQYISFYDAVGTEIEIYDKDDNLIGVSKYPDVIKG